MKPSRILVVDNDRAFLERVQEFLKSSGWRVSTATDKWECWTEIRRRPPDVILADMLLRNSDGFELVRSIKEDRGFNRIPIIAIAGSAGAAERMRCFKAGCDDVLSNHFSLDELSKRLDYLGTA